MSVTQRLFRASSAPEYVRRTVVSHDGTPVVCVHSPLQVGRPALGIVLPFGVPAAVARVPLARFSRCFNVVTWESRHVLATEHPFAGREAISPDDQVADLLAILNALEIEQCRLIGYCSGAGIALLAANTHPRIVTDLILVNGEYQLFRAGHEATPYQRSIDAFLPEAAISREASAAMFKTMAEVARASRGDAPQGTFEALFNAPFSDPERLFRYARNYMAYRGFDALKLAAGIRQPTMVTMGEQDSHAGVANSKVVCAAIPGAEGHVDADGDHYAFCRAGSYTLDLVGRRLQVPASDHTV